jgi:RNA polymerase sigma factor (sigma-70 family)
MEPSDEALVQACRRGEAAAWEALVARYQRLVYAIPRRAGLKEDASGEVFQRVFAALVEQLDRIEQPDRIRAWLVTTARRETWRVGRGESTARLSDPTEDEATGESRQLAGDAPLPDEVVQRLEEQHIVRMGMAALDERCRQLLTLLFYRSDTPSYTEIAARLGTSEGSIGPTRARCLEKLRHRLDKLGLFGA